MTSMASANYETTSQATASSPPPHRPLISIARMVDALLGVDLRSLALLRMALALLILVDLGMRVPDLKALYTDFGVLPRGAVLLYWNHPLAISIHMISGSLEFQAILFLVGMVAALALLVGFHARLATGVLWLFLVSLHVRNPMLQQGGDDLLLALLFWSLFLPLGARYAVDRALDPAPAELPTRVVSIGTIAILLQVTSMYLCAGFLKDGAAWREGTAIYYALNLDQFTTAFGRLLLHFPLLLRGLNDFVLYLERWGPLLFFVPVATPPFRIAVMLLFLALQLGFGVCMYLGTFPWVSTIALAPFLPTAVWERMRRAARARAGGELTVYYDGGCPLCRNTVVLLTTFLLLPEARLTPVQQHPGLFADKKLKRLWFVEDAQGIRYMKFDAVVRLLRSSLLGWPMGFILRWSSAKRLGKRIAEHSAKEHRLWGRAVGWLSGRRVALRPTTPASLFAAACLAYVLAQNAAQVRHATLPPWPPLEFIGRTLRMEQNWKLFAPEPFKDDGWYVLPGQLKDGSYVDVGRGGRLVSWDKPEVETDTYKNFRWRQYTRNLWLPEFVWARVYFAQYLCHAWSDHRPPPKRLDAFEVYFMKEVTLPDYQEPTPEKVLLGSYRCVSTD